MRLVRRELLTVLQYTNASQRIMAYRAKYHTSTGIAWLNPCDALKMHDSTTNAFANLKRQPSHASQSDPNRLTFFPCPSTDTNVGPAPYTSALAFLPQLQRKLLLRLGRLTIHRRPSSRRTRARHITHSSEATNVPSNRLLLHLRLRRPIRPEPAHIK